MRTTAEILCNNTIKVHQINDEVGPQNLTFYNFVRIKFNC